MMPLISRDELDLNLLPQWFGSVVPGVQISSENQQSMCECQVHLTGPDDTHCQPDEEYTVKGQKDIAMW